MRPHGQQHRCFGAAAAAFTGPIGTLDVSRPVRERGVAQDVVAGVGWGPTVVDDQHAGRRPLRNDDTAAGEVRGIDGVVAQHVDLERVRILRDDGTVVARHHRPGINQAIVVGPGDVGMGLGRPHADLGEGRLRKGRSRNQYQ